MFSPPAPPRPVAAASAGAPPLPFTLVYTHPPQCAEDHGAAQTLAALATAGVQLPVRVIAAPPSAANAGRTPVLVDERTGMAFRPGADSLQALNQLAFAGGHHPPHTLPTAAAATPAPTAVATPASAAAAARAELMISRASTVVGPFSSAAPPSARAPVAAPGSAFLHPAEAAEKAGAAGVVAARVGRGEGCVRVPVCCGSDLQVCDADDFCCAFASGARDDVVEFMPKLASTFDTALFVNAAAGAAGGDGGGGAWGGGSSGSGGSGGGGGGVWGAGSGGGGGGGGGGGSGSGAWGAGSGGGGAWGGSVM